MQRTTPWACVPTLLCCLAQSLSHYPSAFPPHPPPPPLTQHAVEDYVGATDTDGSFLTIMDVPFLEVPLVSRPSSSSSSSTDIAGGAAATVGVGASLGASLYGTYIRCQTFVLIPDGQCSFSIDLSLQASADLDFSVSAGAHGGSIPLVVPTDTGLGIDFAFIGIPVSVGLYAGLDAPFSTSADQAVDLSVSWSDVLSVTAGTGGFSVSAAAPSATHSHPAAANVALRLGLAPLLQFGVGWSGGPEFLPIATLPSFAVGVEASMQHPAAGCPGVHDTGLSLGLMYGATPASLGPEARSSIDALAADTFLFACAGGDLAPASAPQPAAAPDSTSTAASAAAPWSAPDSTSSVPTAAPYSTEVAPAPAPASPIVAPAPMPAPAPAPAQPLPSGLLLPAPAPAAAPAPQPADPGSAAANTTASWSVLAAGGLAGWATTAPKNYSFTRWAGRTYYAMAALSAPGLEANSLVRRAAGGWAAQLIGLSWLELTGAPSRLLVQVTGASLTQCQLLCDRFTADGYGAHVLAAGGNACPRNCF